MEISKSGNGWNIIVSIDRDANPHEMIQELEGLKLALIGCTRNGNENKLN